MMVVNNTIWNKKSRLGKRTADVSKVKLKTQMDMSIGYLRKGPFLDSLKDFTPKISKQGPAIKK
jgi:hypothetical protein